MISKAVLDQMKCQHPECDCGVLILSGRCHPGAPEILYRQGNDFKMVCVVCLGDITPLHGRLILKQGEEFPLDNMLFDQHCHPDDALWVSYRQYSGVLEFTCCECNKLVAELILDE